MMRLQSKVSLFLAGAATVLLAASSENLLTNGGFESGVTGWALGVNGDTAAATRIIDSVSGTAKEGKCFHRITVTAVSSQNWHVQLKDPTWTAKEKNIYHFSMWARADAEKSAQISVYGGPDSKDTYRTSSMISLTTEWKQYHQMFISDVEGAGKINFAFVCGFATGTYDLDDVVITEVENTAGTLFANGDFEADGAGWSLYVNSGEGAGTITYPETGAQSGSKFCRIEVTALPAESWEVQLQDGSWASEMGKVYTFSFWAKANVDAAQIQVAAQAGPSRDYAYLDGESFTLTTEWAQYVYSYETDSVFGSDSISFNVYVGAGLGTYDFDNISLSVTGTSAHNPVYQRDAQSQQFTVRRFADHLQCVPDSKTLAGKITVHDIQGRVFYSRPLPLGRIAGTGYNLPLPPSGAWIVKVTHGTTEQHQRIIIP